MLTKLEGKSLSNCSIIFTILFFVSTCGLIYLDFFSCGIIYLDFLSCVVLFQGYNH